MTRVRVSSAAVWIAGRFAETPADLKPSSGDASVRAEISVTGLFTGDRIPRADRVTQLGALVLARAIRALEPCEPDETAVITASVLATAYTNERFERRRMESRPPEPRAFPYTAPNAAGGEFSIALRARGPTLALVGGHEVGLAALERACRWIERSAARRVVVIATECPPEHPRLVSPPGVDPVECAAAVVLERADAAADDALRIRYVPSAVGHRGVDALLSVGPIGALWLSPRATVITVASAAGAALEARIGGIAGS